MVISEWMREEAQKMADTLVEMNVTEMLDGSVSGFGMRSRVVALLDELKAALFPSMYEQPPEDKSYLNILVADRLNSACILLCGIIRDVLFNKCQQERSADCDQCRSQSEALTLEFMEAIPEIRALLTTDIQAAYEGDPAAIYMEEILLSYPSIEAVSIYRLAHKLWELKIPIIPRIMTEYAHQCTGIDIHPGAKIGKHFFIDHGTGVVIGETCVIGDNVKLYQGVTLGAKSFELDADGNPVKGVKRHPNIEDDVIIYSGATILGGLTTVGRGSVIGGNVWLVHSVPPNTRAYNSTPQPNIESSDEHF